MSSNAKHVERRLASGHVCLFVTAAPIGRYEQKMLKRADRIASRSEAELRPKSTVNGKVAGEDQERRALTG